MKPLSPTVASPKAGSDFRNTEFFVFEGDRVKRIEVYFGAAYDNGVFVKQPPPA